MVGFRCFPGDPWRAVNAPSKRLFRASSTVRWENVFPADFFNDWDLQLKAAENTIVPRSPFFAFCAPKY